MRRGRAIWFLAATLAGVGALACSLGAAYRIRDFHRNYPREVFVFRRVFDTAFTYAGHPVRFENDLTNPAAPVLVLTYADQTIRIPVTVPGNYKLPDLLPHDDWLRVLRMAGATHVTPTEFLKKLDTGEIPDRLIIVARIPLPGSDQQTWGKVWKKQWSFDFYELSPDGTVVRTPRLKYPSTSGLREPKPGELNENTWQYQAALQTMPQAGAIGPAHNFFGNALRAAGVMLPGAAFLGLACTILTAFGCAPRRRATGTPVPPQSDWGHSQQALG